MRAEHYERALDRRPKVPVMVRAHLASPLCSDDGLVHLDSVVLHAVLHKVHYPHIKHRPWAVTSRDHLQDPPPLPFARERGVWCCSCLTPDSNERSRIAWSQRPTVEHMHLAAPSTVRLNGGETRLRRETETLWPTPTMTAWAIAEPTMLRLMLARIPAVGHQRGHGYGRIAAWEVVEDERALALWWQRPDGTAARPLPHPNGTRTGIKPPYWYRPWWQPAILPGEQLAKST